MELHPALRPLAGDVQVRAGQGGRHAGTRPRRDPRRAQRRRQDLDLQAPPGVKFEDGTPITSKDVKYAVERSLDKKTFPNGPTYFNDFLDLQGYTSPYKDTDPNKLGLKAIDTPDDQTIVFHLAKPFSGFDYFAQLPATIPVPAAKDTGTKYKEHVVSSGPYMFETNDLGKSFTMVRNPNWDPATDPNRKPLPDGIDVALNVNSDDIDNRLQAGDLDVAIEGSGVGPAAQGKILADQTLKANTDSATVARLWYANINSDVAPLDNIHCRKAIEYAADKHRLPARLRRGHRRRHRHQPAAPGHSRGRAVRRLPLARQRGRRRQGQGRAGAVRPAQRLLHEHLLPGRAAEGEGHRRVAAAVAGQGRHQPDDQALPARRLLQALRGQARLRQGQRPRHHINGWGADWPDGYGFLAQIVDSRVIRATGGNTNLGVKDPEVDAMMDKALRRPPTPPPARRSGSTSTRR